MIDELKLTKRDILENFDDRTYTRGHQYYAENRVKYYTFFDNGDGTSFVQAKVSGTRNYEQYIVFSEYNDLLIESQCSCPVHTDCKHAVAVLFKMMSDKGQMKTVNDPEHWLKKFMQIHQPKEKVEAYTEQEYFMIIRLFREGTDDFDLCKAKYLKNGSISKGAKVSNENMMYYFEKTYYYPYLTDDDRKLIGQLKNTSNGAYHSEFKFKDEYGALMLKKLVATGKCYYRDNVIPLSYRNENKLLTFEWVEKEGKAQLVPNLYSNEELILNTIPKMCIDMDENTLCEVETAYSSEEIVCLFNAPEMSIDEMTKVTQKVVEKLPNVDFPLPETFEIEEFSVAPKPYLYLYGKKNMSKTMHAMELHFMYEAYEYNAYPFHESEIVSQRNKILKVLRDREKERAYREVIELLGFEFDNFLQGYMSFAKPSMQEAIERWRNFMENHLEKLRESGWDIEIDESFNFSFEYADAIVVESAEGGDTNPWFELSFSVEVGGRSVALMPIVNSLLEEYDSVDEIPEKLNLEMEDGKFLHIESREIKPILNTIFELFDKKEGDTLVIKPYDAHLLELDEESNIVWKGAKELKELSLKLKNFKGIESVVPAKTLNATLRDYQQFGLDWLNFLHTFKFAGILADDMGLGKTVQTLAFLQVLKSKTKLNGPTLIVMPTSLIGNWKNEIEKFTPELSYLALYGIDRAEKFKEIEHYDIILTTYQLAQRDEEKYKKEKFFYIILDEAQKIKNPKTKMALAIKSFSSEHKLALSGTPIENHLGELWSIFDFLMPGFLDNLKFFKALYQNPIEKENDMTRREMLNKKVAPFILRRTKDEVALELPGKTEIIKRATFGKKQATLYENIRITMEKKVREAIKGKGLSRSHITILDALLKLRQVCCHPQLLKLEAAKKVSESAKLELFLELIDELQTEGRKVLVFSQFTSMLAIIEEEIKKREYSYSKLTGATRKRDEAIDKFTKGDASIFLISLKAGGVGLNLVAADTVIHYDPWWNPAVENQATDRAYRIGQDKPVFVYKLIIENSIEEQILKLQEKKKSLQEGIYKGRENKEEKFNGEELVALLKI
ncbi:MAG: DEAD/DEAH box helicase family protein [Sulfurovum sp.]|nr:DEAD/DEAH box helicase family protein [Sulfurovum sp.]